MARLHASRTHTSRVLTILAVIALLVAFIVPVGADDVLEIQAGTPEAVAGDPAGAEEFSSWFVELGTPTVDGASAAQTDADKKLFRDHATRKGITYTERYAYSDLFNGLSITVSGDALAKIRSIPGVKNVWPVVTESLPTGTGAGEVIDLATAIEMTGAKYAQETLGLSGRNVKVAIMDTGVDYHHPDLGGCFAADGCRVIRGWDFVGNAFNADSASPTYNPVMVPDNDPDDCNGHGTHVAGIVGANGTVVGVAPNVKFGAYRVFGCAGSTTSDIMLAAMERALHDNMDVLNMSIGSSLQWPQYPTAAAADRLVTKKGMVVVASIGNSGPAAVAPLGLYAAGAPGVGANVIGVASFDNTAIAQSAFRARPDGRLIPYSLASGTSVGPPTAGEFPLATNASIFACPPAAPTAPSIGGSPWAAGSLTGKVALIQRGGCSFYLKAIHAQQAGASAVVLFNNVAGTLNPTVAFGAGQPPVTIPVVAITLADGNLLVSRMPTTLTWGTDTVTSPSATGGTISGFSSYGVAADLSFKPDIGGPGGNIRSTWPLELGAYNNISGTSMASPHVAGTVALYLEANRSQKAPAIRDILQNSASPRNFPANTFLDSVHRQGAGMVDIRAALEATALVTPGKLALGESQGGPASRTITVRNTGAQDLTFIVSHQPGASTGCLTITAVCQNTDFSWGVNTAAATATHPATLAVAKGGSASVNVTITAPAAGLDRLIYGGWIVLSASDGTTYRVPYSGFKGDYQAIVVLTRTDRLNVCRSLGGGSFAPGGGTFTFANAGQTPNFCVHFDHQSRNVTYLVKDGAGSTVGTASSQDYFARNSTPSGSFAQAWDGTVTNGGVSSTVPNGTYTIEIRVLKALGDSANAAHTEVRTLAGSITIARP